MRTRPQSRCPAHHATADEAFAWPALHRPPQELESFCTVPGNVALRFIRYLKGKGNGYFHVRSVDFGHLQRAVFAVMQAQAATNVGQPQSMAIPQGILRLEQPQTTVDQP